MAGSHINLQPKTGCPLKLSRVEGPKPQGSDGDTILSKSTVFQMRR